MSSAADAAAWLDAVESLALRAGAAVMDVYRRGSIATRFKADASPVTDADETAEALILEGLRSLDPHTPTVSEEACSAGAAPQFGRCFWLVDPLDGTREFIARNGEFTVNIALVEDARPVLGVVLAPAQGRWWAGAVGFGSHRCADGSRQPIVSRPAPSSGLVVVASRSHGDDARLRGFLAGQPVARIERAGSSLKFGLIAAGEADLYPRIGRTMEWDTAAGHAVLAAAGGRVETMDGRPLVYGKPGFENPDFVARGAG